MKHMFHVLPPWPHGAYCVRVGTNVSKHKHSLSFKDSEGNFQQTIQENKRLDEHGRPGCGKAIQPRLE